MIGAGKPMNSIVADVSCISLKFFAKCFLSRRSVLELPSFANIHNTNWFPLTKRPWKVPTI